MLRSNIFAKILSQAIEAAGRIEATVEMVFEQEMDGTDVWEFASVNLLALIVLSKKLTKLRRTEHRSQPVPLIVVPDK